MRMCPEEAEIPAPLPRNDATAGLRWLLVCDDATTPTEGASWVYCWNGHSTPNGVHSLLQYVERHAERLRRQYLAWVHDLGETEIKGRRLVDHLLIADGLSHWWMTLLAEKSLYKSDLSDVIRILALDDIVRTLKPDAIRLVSAKPALHQALRQLSARLALPYSGKLIGKAGRRSRGKWWSRLPFSLRALGYLGRHFVRQGSLRRDGPGVWSGGEEAVFFCSYFFHFPVNRAEAGVFESGYWTDLPARLLQSGRKANWLQIFYRHDGVPDSRTGQRLIDALNQKSDATARHRFLDSYLSWRLGWIVLLRWTRLKMRSLRLRGIEEAFRPRGVDVSLWPLLRENWLDSLHGVSAIQGLLFQALFDRALQDIPIQRNGFYLCENQAWERAMIHAWRKHGHGRLTGVAHATLRFWDLRYFHDPRTVNNPLADAMPQPDLLALNGEAAFKACREAQFPAERLVACEALRFNYLHQLQRSGSGGLPASGSLRVLVLGDYLEASTIKMLRMLEKAAIATKTKAAYTIKPHPNLEVAPADYPDLALQVTSQPLAELLTQFDVAYSSNLTSVSVDAYCAGLRIVVMLDGAELNFSPLRGWPGVQFAGDAASLANALDSWDSGTEAGCSPDFFYLDPELPRWLALLSV